MAPMCRPPGSLRWRAAVLLGLGLFAACRGKRPEAPVDLEASVELGASRVLAAHPLAVTYTWAVGTNAPRLRPTERAFVHFVDASNVLLFTDDHVPEPPPSSWEPGRRYSYTRLVLVPPLPFTGNLEMRVGLFDTQGAGGRRTLKGQHRGMQEYRVASVELLPDDDRARLTFKDGWYPPESPAGSPFLRTRWMKREAFLEFRNRNKDVILILEGDTADSFFDETPRLTIAVGDQGIVMPVEGPEPLLAKVSFKAEALGEDRWATLRLSMDRWFVPREKGGSADERELSFSLRYVFVGEAERLHPLVRQGAMAAAPLGR